MQQLFNHKYFPWVISGIILVLLIFSIYNTTQLVRMKKQTLSSTEIPEPVDEKLSVKEEIQESTDSTETANEKTEGKEEAK